MDFFTAGCIIRDHGYFGQKRRFKVDDEFEWYGLLVDYYDIFISVWTLIRTACKEVRHIDEEKTFTGSLHLLQFIINAT